MLAVSRANLDHICCICLLDVRPSVFTQKVYDVKKENNMAKVLQITAHISILKNPINQRYFSDYCRKIIASTATLKELLESGDLNKQDIERLNFFCRICLNRQTASKDVKYLNMAYLNWLKDCTGIRFTSINDAGMFRIKEGTNINEIAVINDVNFPQQLCPNCFKKLQNVEEFRKSATQSFEYMISVMGDASGPEDYVVAKEAKHLKENIIWRNVPQSQPVIINNNLSNHNCAVLRINNINDEKELENSNLDVMESMINAANYSRTQHVENDNFEVMDIIDDLPHYSDDSDKDYTLELSNMFADCSDNDNRSKCLRKTRTNQSNQRNINIQKQLNSKGEIVETENPFKQNPRTDKKLKENEILHIGNMKSTDETFVCNECSQSFATRYTYKRHQRSVHQPDSSQTMHECLLCSKKFKRKSHLTDHIKTVHEKLRPFKCAHCTKTFSANSSKRVHELTHTGDYPFLCKWCNKGFRRASQLKIHLEIHTTNPELLCPICKRSQKSQADLENHLKSHDDKRLQCPLCGKFFTRSYHLKDHHNAVHLKLRPFKCEFCELAFGDRKTRRIHEKSHTEERPVTCGVCKSGFKTHFSLSRHINQFGHKTGNCENRNKTKKKHTVKSINPHYTEKLHLTLEP